MLPWSGSLLSPAQRGAQVAPLTAAQDLHGDGLARRQQAQSAAELVYVRDRLSVQGEQGVAQHQPGLFGRASALDLDQQERALLLNTQPLGEAGRERHRLGSD